MTEFNDPHGDIDVTNAAAMTEYTLGHATRSRGLILDLSGLDFSKTEGFSALHRAAVGCARTGRAWSLVPGAAVSRLLRIGDLLGSLPPATPSTWHWPLSKKRSPSTTAGREPQGTAIRLAIPT